MKRAAYLLLLFARAALAMEFIVATTGSDEAAGTREAPFATIDRAIAAVRAAAKDQPITVLIHGGTYWLDKPIELTAADSGKPDAPIVYANFRGESPTFSGG